jgi:hypothetical protein
VSEAATVPEVVIETIGGNCPVQAEGTIDGWPFYFRARGTRWSFEVSEPGFEACGEAVWDHVESYGDGPYAAGWMDEDEARAFIEQAAERFVAWRKANPAVDGNGRRTAEVLRAELHRTYERLGHEARARMAAERRVVRLSRELGLDTSDLPIAEAQVRNGVKD